MIFLPNKRMIAMSRAHKLEVGVDSQETRISLLEQNNAHTLEVLRELKSFFFGMSSNMNQGFDRIDKKMDLGFDKINGRIWSNFYWGVAGFSTVLGVLAHAMHWV